MNTLSSDHRPSYDVLAKQYGRRHPTVLGAAHADTEPHRTPATPGIARASSSLGATNNLSTGSDVVGGSDDFRSAAIGATLICPELVESPRPC